VEKAVKEYPKKQIRCWLFRNLNVNVGGAHKHEAQNQND
jgi:hypothetical protein